MEDDGMNHVDKKQAKRLVRQLRDGEELWLDDPNMVRYVTKIMGRPMRKGTFVARDKRHRKTLLRRM